MERVEYTATDNKIGISIKCPTGINRKWSEKFIQLECDSCGSTDIDATITGDALAVICLNCPNHWYGDKNTVLNWHNSEEALIPYPVPIPFSEH